MIIRTEYEDPRQVKITNKGKTVRGKCNQCGKWVALTHKTKEHPHGTRLHKHLNDYSSNCYGIPTFMTGKRM